MTPDENCSVLRKNIEILWVTLATGKLNHNIIYMTVLLNWTHNPPLVSAQVYLIESPINIMGALKRNTPHPEQAQLSNKPHIHQRSTFPPTRRFRQVLLSTSELAWTQRWEPMGNPTHLLICLSYQLKGVCNLNFGGHNVHQPLTEA